MGRNNQQRRAKKKRRESTRGPAWGSQAAGPSDPCGSGQQSAEPIEAVARRGAAAAALGAQADFEAACSSLAQAARSAGGSVTTGVGRAFCSQLRLVWEHGWQPAEVARQMGRRRGRHHFSIAVAAMGDGDAWLEARDAAVPPQWEAQLDEMEVPRRRPAVDWLARWMRSSGLSEADALAVTLEALGVLLQLPKIERLVPPPSEWSKAALWGAARGPDDAVLIKIRALLAKAESTGFEAESDALTAKAQELMTRHAIDDARSRAEEASQERPIARRVAIDDPYAAAKSYLLQVVAGANGVRSVWYEDFAMMALVGFSGDLEAVEVLFTSLLLQGSRAMLAQGSITDEWGRSRTRSFRQSFLLAYAGRIHERLTVAAVGARRHAEEELATSLLPVLAGRDDQVDEAVTAMFPRLVATARPSVTNESGWRAGRVAAELATLGPDRGMLDRMAAAG
jgi:hypothetical protein